jgi:hypothetical protein
MDVTPERADRIAAEPVMRFARWVVPWVLLAVVAYVSLGYYNGYRDQTTKLERPAGSKETTAKAPAAKSKTATSTAPSQVVAVTDVNLHIDASAASDTIRTLKKDEKVTLVAKEGDWYKVTDSGGQIGYLTTSATYTKVVASGK